PPPLDQQFRDLIKQFKKGDVSKEGSHPAYQWIITQLSPDEAAIIKFFAKEKDQPYVRVKTAPKIGLGSKVLMPHFSRIAERVKCNHPKNIYAYIDNLIRLGLLTTDEGDPGKNHYYISLERHEDLDPIREQLKEEANRKLVFDRCILKLSAFGGKFCEFCVKSEF
ncbi:DUF4393 domain-containing protein, partial [Deltaproteobacteria bacterium TL4]